MLFSSSAACHAVFPAVERCLAVAAQRLQFAGVSQWCASAATAVSSASEVVATWPAIERVCFLAIVDLFEDELRKALVDSSRVLLPEGPPSHFSDLYVALVSATRQSLCRVAGHDAGAVALVSRAQSSRFRPSGGKTTAPAWLCLSIFQFGVQSSVLVSEFARPA